MKKKKFVLGKKLFLHKATLVALNGSQQIEIAGGIRTVTVPGTCCMGPFSLQQDTCKCPPPPTIIMTCDCWSAGNSCPYTNHNVCNNC
ncbi:class I lanthipeptide [Chitinophaga nivalis]|uniref:Class I lanthipeptide n=1 Tax=Chitinophaga nivalis TaxID=2991709 RepID=A0ABT3ILA8_9BACT|nr:class I lanthipeptide [Chitinophaga nivalis]MCW3465550.1 class I lanthipeptide [Chitinophaga nivalis]MCW3484759.1 class I lanthipeptide [Chitinophaga nivalis]